MDFVDYDLPDFPRCTLKELLYFTLRIYQFKQSRLYTHENLNQSWLYSLRHNPNIEWCQCKVGARVVGGYAHVASVLWYLAYWCHNHTQTKPPSLGYTDTLQDAATGWFSDDSASESEKEIQSKTFVTNSLTLLFFPVLSTL
ncbi:uncharacterized protein TNCT_473751 [Trichonephila clavata]|uniref:Uncharacterized protein n=1 Tax=Trichonephila clavata TaxID=2740835 RepID=A0A8X6HMB8_TRICU|nr:uncharacterized protein TNCT_473751 [Trichonephila clavata]